MAKKLVEKRVLFVSMLKLESKMKNIAETTARGIKEIFDEASLENPEAAAKISFSGMETVMTNRRRALRPKNPEEFKDIVRTLVNSPVYGCQLQ
jgi:hypothetical protein